MHTNHGSIEIRSILRHLTLHIIEVWNRFGIIKLHRISIEANELDSRSYEREIWTTKHFQVSLFAGSQTVVVAEQSDKWHFQLEEFLPCPFKFTSSTKVSHIAAMNHEVDTITLVDVRDFIREIGQILMSIADEGKSDGIFRLHQLFYLDNLLGIDLCLTLHTDIVGMDIKHRVAT